MTIDDNCPKHDWWYEKGDYCPECKGAEDERKRILAIIKGSPTALEFLQPYIGTETLIRKIESGE
jgi:hypothetical protein